MFYVGTMHLLLSRAWENWIKYIVLSLSVVVIVVTFYCCSS